MTEMEVYLAGVFQSACQFYFADKFRQNKFLYFHLIPHKYFGTDYKVAIEKQTFQWIDQPQLTYSTNKIPGPGFNKKKCEFIQNCHVNYILAINGILIPGQQQWDIKFYGETTEPLGQYMSATIIQEDIEILDRYNKMINNIKDQFNMSSLETMSFPEGKTGFDFYTDIVRKQRASQPKNTKIKHGYVFFEIAHCHSEIEQCVSKVLFYQKYMSDLMGKKSSFEDGRPFFIPNFSYVDYQYLLWVGFAFDRLYAFWDRLVYLLHNYHPLSLDASHVTFDGYLKKLVARKKSNVSIGFAANSENIDWLIRYYEKHYSQKLTNIRHRIVHYQITDSWEGMLGAKFSSNALEFNSDEASMKALTLEFESLGYYLLEQFNLGTEGFIKTMQLIDELP